MNNKITVTALKGTDTPWCVGCRDKENEFRRSRYRVTAMSDSKNYCSGHARKLVDYILKGGKLHD